MTEKKPKRKQGIRYIEKLIHKYIREYIIKRDGGKCIVCGDSKGPLQAGHVIPAKACRATRFDSQNIVCQCRKCNQIHKYAPHKLFMAYIQRFGIDYFFELCAQAQPGYIHSRADMLELLDHYKWKAASL